MGTQCEVTDQRFLGSRTWRQGVGVCAVLLYAFAVMPVQAGTSGPPTPTPTPAEILQGVPGQTELQDGAGGFVGTTCEPLLPLAAPSELVLDLRNRCTELVVTAANGGGAFDLGLNDAELNGALQQMVSEETAALSSLATQTISGQALSISARLGQLQSQLAGAATGTLTPREAGTEAIASVTLGRRGGGAGDGDPGRFGLFINPTGGFGDGDGTDREDEFDFHNAGFTAGLDYRFTDALVLGVAYGFDRLKADFDTSATVAGGSVTALAQSISGYGVYYHGSLYVDGIVSYGNTRHDITRRILIPGNGAGNAPGAGASRTAGAATDSDQFSIGATGGYEFRRDALTFGPLLRANYLDMDIDDYQESGAMGLNLQVDDQSVESFTTGLGGQVSYAASTKFGVLQPQVRAEWIHEFEDESRTIKAQFVNDPNNNTFRAETDKPDRDYFTLAAGVSAALEAGKQVFFEYETLLGHRDVSNHAFTAGMRLEF